VASICVNLLRDAEPAMRKSRNYKGSVNITLVKLQLRYLYTEGGMISRIAKEECDD
jgi:hypothetical protein